MKAPDGGCVGSFVETPVASIDFNIPSTSKGKVQRNDCKVKNPPKQRKDLVTKDIRSFSGGSSSLKSSGPLNSKGSFTDTVSSFFETKENTLDKMQSRIQIANDPKILKNE